MNEEIASTLEKAIEFYNSKVDETQQLDWWDVLDCIDDITDNKQVANAVSMICKMAVKMI